jgi:hypothetical protein
MDDGTKIGWFKREITAWREAFINNPLKTIVLGFALVVLIGLSSIAPRAFNDLYSLLIHQKPEEPFSATKIIYSNFVPFDYDIIDLDKSGTLTPSPYNKYFDLSSKDICSSNNKSLIDYSQGIVLILNLPVTLSSRDFQDPSKLARGITFEPPPQSSYFTFKLGATKEISSGGRKFLVTLSRINDLSTPENGEYYSYVFDINEK